MKGIISFTIRNELKENIDLLRGDIPRSRFLTRLIESYIQKNVQNKINIDIRSVDNVSTTDSQQIMHTRKRINHDK